MFKPKSQPEYQKYKTFRVRGHIKSFRDLEVYKKTTELSSQIFTITLPPKITGKKLLENELDILRTLSKYPPKFIAESYGNKFTDRPLAYLKLEKAMECISNIIAKIDFLIALINHQGTKQTFIKLISKYQVWKRKILNLKKAWIRIDEKYGKKQTN